VPRSRSYNLINELTDQAERLSSCVSSEMAEILGMSESDYRHARWADYRELNTEQASQEKIIEA